MTPPIELGRDSPSQRETRGNTPEIQRDRPRQNPEIIRNREKLESLKNLPSNVKSQLGEDFNERILEIESDLSQLESGTGATSHLEREVRRNFNAIENKFDDLVISTIEGIGKEPVREQTPEPVTVQPETQRGGWDDAGFNENTSDNQPPITPSQESGSGTDVISVSNASLGRLNLYREYLIFKGEGNSSLLRFINDIKNHAHLPKIEGVIGEVDEIMKNYMESGIISISTNAGEKLSTIKRESKVQRDSMSGQIQDSLIEEEVSPNIIFGRFPFVNPEMRSMRGRIEELKEMSIDNLVSEITNNKGEVNIDYQSMDNNVEKELNQFIKQSKDPELKQFFEDNKEDILEALEKKEELFNQLKSELQFTVDYYNTNKEHLDDSSKLILENNMKSLTAYMLFINGLHDINILTYFVSILKRASVTGNVYDMLMLIDDVVAYAFLGGIGLTYVARFGGERKNRNSFLNSTNVDDEGNTSKRSFSSQAGEILKPGSLSGLESMDLEKMYAQFEVNEDGVPQKLKHLSVQAENIKSLIEIVSIYERMGADSDVIIKLTNLKNSAVWGNRKIFSREVFKISYGLSSGNGNHINKGKNWFFRIVDLRLVENIRDIRGKRVIGAPANLPWDNKVSNIINGSINLLFPKGHGIDDFGKKDAPEVLRTFIKQNIEITTEGNRLESWLENNSRSKNPKLGTHNQNTLKYTLREIISESMDESYNQAKTIVDRLEVNGSPITDLETRADLIDKIERVLDQNKGFKNTRIASQIQGISFFSVLRNNGRTNYSVTINGLPLNESTNEISKLIQEGSNSFKDISTSLKKAEGETVGTKNVRNYLIARLNSRLGLSLNVGDVFNGSSISKVSEEEGKARDISKENTGKNLKKLGSHFTGPTPDLSKLSPEDIGKLEKLTDTMLKVEEVAGKERLPNELKEVVKENLKKVADDIGDGKYGDNVILKENITEIPKIGETIDAFSEIFDESEMKSKVFPTFINGLEKADRGSMASKLYGFKDLAKNDFIAGDDEIRNMFKDAFTDPSKINTSVLNQLRIYANKMNNAEAIVGKDGVLIQTADDVRDGIRNNLLHPESRSSSNPSPNSNQPQSTPTRNTPEVSAASEIFDESGKLKGEAAKLFEINILRSVLNSRGSLIEQSKIDDFLAKDFKDINEFRVELGELTGGRVVPSTDRNLARARKRALEFQARDIIERSILGNGDSIPRSGISLEIRGENIVYNGNIYDSISELRGAMVNKYGEVPSWEKVQGFLQGRNKKLPTSINLDKVSRFDRVLNTLRKAI